MSLEYPQIYHVGLMKTGTTTIQEVLCRDSRINLILKSGFFNTNKYFTDKYSHFEKDKVNIESDETISRGLNYYGLDECLKRISKKNPNAKIIITIREQRALLLSAYKHHIRQTDDAYSFLDFLNSSTGFNYIKHLDYNNLYLDVSRYFDESNIFFYPYELMNENFEEFFRIIYSDVIKLEMPAYIKKLHSNMGVADRIVICKKNLNRMRIFRSDKFFGKLEKTLHKLILKIYTLIFINRDKTISWEESALCKSLEVLFSKSNSNFAKNYGLELSKYGYLTKEDSL